MEIIPAGEIISGYVGIGLFQFAVCGLVGELFFTWRRLDFRDDKATVVGIGQSLD